MDCAPAENGKGDVVRTYCFMPLPPHHIMEPTLLRYGLPSSFDDILLQSVMNTMLSNVSLNTELAFVSWKRFAKSMKDVETHTELSVLEATRKEMRILEAAATRVCGWEVQQRAFTDYLIDTSFIDTSLRFVLFTGGGGGGG
jgi:hypothetical protein